MTEIKFSASVQNKNKVYKQLHQRNQKVHTALVCLLQQRVTADAQERVQQGKQIKTIPSK